jgi:hypothetical protein
MKVKEVLGVLHGGSSGRHLCVNKNHRHSDTVVLMAAREEQLGEVVPTVQHLCSKQMPSNPEVGSDAPFERISIKIAGSFPESQRGNQ